MRTTSIHSQCFHEHSAKPLKIHIVEEHALQQCIHAQGVLQTCIHEQVRCFASCACMECTLQHPCTCTVANKTSTTPTTVLPGSVLKFWKPTNMQKALMMYIFPLSVSRSAWVNQNKSIPTVYMQCATHASVCTLQGSRSSAVLLKTFKYI